MRAPERERFIVDEAIRFFAEQGFGGQTRELAKRMGITHSAIYRHFPSKEALIERVYEGDADVDSNSIEVIIGRLRRKIGAQRIETVRGRGYRLTAGA